MFGPHLTLDLYHCNKQKLSDAEFIAKFLRDFPEFINMHRISEPQVTEYEGREGSFDKGGISAFVLLAESHVSVHTFPNDQFASVDVFSCKEFDFSKAQEFIMKAFDAKKAEKNLLIRGKEFVKHYPRSVSNSKHIVDKERKKITH
jgi:S-adenosylmethionine decarboxylase